MRQCRRIELNHLAHSAQLGIDATLQKCRLPSPHLKPTMAPLRILKIPLFRVFGARGATPILPLTARQAARARSPPMPLGRGSRQQPLNRRAYSTSPSPPPSPTGDSAAPTTLSGRLKHLIKTHGWYALGVYIGIGLVDFSLSFVAIYLLGADQVGAVTDKLKDQMTQTIGWPAPSSSSHDIGEGTVAVPNHSNSLYAIAILAYGIHKTLFLPVRVGLTAGFTPKFVAFLTRRGWVGKGGLRRAGAHMREKVQSEASRARTQ